MQVQRLITVMGAQGVHKHALLEDALLDKVSDALSTEEKLILRGAGWIEGTGLRALLNFSGEYLLSRPLERGALSRFYKGSSSPGVQADPA